jgi:vacuolar-type H+-ATPase subunit F/Vma7
LFSLKVLTDYENAPGFELTGVDVSKVGSPEEAMDKVRDFIEKKVEGIVILNQSHFDNFDDKFKKEIDACNMPIFMTFPDVKGWGEHEPETKYVTQLIQRALGYTIKIKGT